MPPPPLDRRESSRAAVGGRRQSRPVASRLRGAPAPRSCRHLRSIVVNRAEPPSAAGGNRGRSHPGYAGPLLPAHAATSARSSWIEPSRRRRPAAIAAGRIPATRGPCSLLMPPPPLDRRESSRAAVGGRRQSRPVASPLRGAPAPCSCRHLRSIVVDRAEPPSAAGGNRGRSHPRYAGPLLPAHAATS